ncbi:hypothetical protein UFOVP143_24 [uncultured Caudovirales phage]|uniref:Uncharacterized protein n=1 Tax=uncultured Caudovirales phage TaxID=2100421 RepID=A0A6J7VQD2_9CAUD|nr:hypothetical protein UFOVP143_24 [uncultured Caudovirales phage]
MHLASLTDQELVSYFRTTRNDFTTTTLEAELAERLAAAIETTPDEIRDLENAVSELEGKLEDAQKEARDLEEENGTLEDQIYDLKNEAQRLQDEIEKLKNPEYVR